MTGPAAGSPRWLLVTVDIDGTLTAGHGWRQIAEHTGRLAEYEASERRFVAGETGEDEHLAELLHLADGLRLTEFEGLLASTQRHEGITTMVDRWHAEGTKVALLTHNPPYVTSWYQRTFGFDGAAGTDVPGPKDGVIRLEGPVRADKIQGLRRLVSTFSVPPVRIAHIGDGAADARVFPYVGAGVALNSPLAWVREAADLSLKISDLSVLPEIIDQLRPRTRLLQIP